MSYAQPTTASVGPLWTQDESIAFEAAKECINDLAGIYTGMITVERAKASPDDAKIAAYSAMRTVLVMERQDLRLSDSVAIERARRVYGARIRSHRAGAA